MQLKNSFIGLSVSILFFTACQTPQKQTQNPNSAVLPGFKLNTDKNVSVVSDLDGKIQSIQKNENGQYDVSVQTSRQSYLNNRIETNAYEMVYGNLSKIESTLILEQEVQRGTPIGTGTPDSYVTARSKTLLPFMVRLSERQPVKQNDFWYFSPDWMFSHKTDFLSFRPVPSFEEALKDFYHRWEVEKEEKKGFTIHHHPDLDRIRFSVKLNQYPKTLTETFSLTFTEKQFYGKENLFVFENKLDEFKISGYTPVIYWQSGFDKHLKEEYILKNTLYVYASIYTIDHEKKLILICARDFALSPDEKVIGDRINSLLKPQ
ncbi:hypothetical protein CH370_02275 [Leptospira kmetyi]|uniref:Uncharacterized protein n=1 Tax=Leptospira kmetyi TaxID=408139 RepID=A0A2M9XVF2_9LEPT|nr:hypothetical protein [Leptospira kmetyi]AYV57059.1 hypothetical protein EFP84_17135 [Leptospira kmetyi]PJZ43274.1 hypothetical protein CH370_02275 [Leptospira kmetyi]TGL68128.1 hypothetical protein EHQ67_13130 [Leptospira kmetyi]